MNAEENADQIVQALRCCGNTDHDAMIHAVRKDLEMMYSYKRGILRSMNNRVKNGRPIWGGRELENITDLLFG